MKTQREKKNTAVYELHRILYSGCSDEFTRTKSGHKFGSSFNIYDPDFHPQDAYNYFREAYDQIKDPERYCTDKGVIGYVTKPVRPPSAAGYAAKIGVARDTIWAWQKKHNAFAEAMSIGKSMQEAILIELGSTGGLVPTSVNFILKNLQGWTDKLEETLKGSVALRFDADDEDV